MTVARSLLVDRTGSGLYHCISRCVRRAFLCGDGFDHRKDWIRDRLQLLAEVFAIDVAAYAVMSNHLHIVLRTDPDRVKSWSNLEVARRWSVLFPRDVRVFAGVPAASIRDPVSETAIHVLAKNADRIAVLRDRLGNLSWFMKCLKEPVARRANREDGCTGTFWEGRFRSIALLDDAAVLACMVYVDLNVIRAALAATPERSDHTSVQDRIHVRQLYEKLAGKRSRASKRAASLLVGIPHAPRSAEDGIWLAPIGHGGDDGRHGLLPMSLDEYLEIVDITARMARSNKSGVISKNMPPILERLEIDVHRWNETMRGLGRRLGTAIGSVMSRVAEARRRGSSWVVAPLDVSRHSLTQVR